MISAMPEIQTRELGPTDEFIVVACDGIWWVSSLKAGCVIYLRESVLHASYMMQTIITVEI